MSAVEYQEETVNMSTGRRATSRPKPASRPATPKRRSPMTTSRPSVTKRSTPPRPRR